MYQINDIADFIIFRLNADENNPITHLKLQKLLYYTQAWHMAFYNTKLFDGQFQAWIHGPVNREIYNRFKDTKYLYSHITNEDIKNISISDSLNNEAIIHIDSILEAYDKYSGIELEIMTHNEEPWIAARKGYSSNQRCETEIDETLMQSYYAKRLK
ncbi:MAG: DUF4065 domain-containing protein [Flavobacterium sp.]|nr:MAG: DUF4065 domain-containing protein [Flavobacterium sp.]